MTPTNIVVKGKRPGQTEFAYYNRFFSENAEVNGNPDPERSRKALLRKAEAAKSFWLSYEPEGTVLVVENEELGKPKPIKATDQRTPTGAPFINRRKRTR